jgi:hypothetical protein
VGTVDIPGLAKVGSGVEGCHFDFARVHSGASGRLDPGLDPAWSAGAATAKAAVAWQAFLVQLAGQVQDLGRNLSTSAREFQAADDRAAGRTDSAGAGIPAGHPAQARAHGYYQ